MSGIVRGYEAAFTALYDRYGNRMYRYFYRMLWQDAGRAEDFAQDLFLKIIEKPHMFHPDRNFRTWLYALALNMCRNEYRRRKPVESVVLEAAEELPSGPFPDAIDRQLFEQELRGVIDQLSESHKQCFVLRYQEELTVTEIALVVGCPEGTIKSRLHFAVRKIAYEMESWKVV